jgi:hypothetical protein
VVAQLGRQLGTVCGTAGDSTRVLEFLGAPHSRGDQGGVRDAVLAVPDLESQTCHAPVPVVRKVDDVASWGLCICLHQPHVVVPVDLYVKHATIT